MSGAPRNGLELVAFFLPQYHPIPENDRWWGKGFTEWRHVASARPLFEGHLQPRLPADLGFYDLRVLDTRAEQWGLADDYGVTAFCYWYYWFGGGRRLLERPLDMLLDEPSLPHRYCLGWANETWTGWYPDGGVRPDLRGRDEILSAQHYLGPADDNSHFDMLRPHLEDERYMRVAGDRPVYYLYRPDQLPYLEAFVDRFRTWSTKNGLGNPYIVGEAPGAWVDKVPGALDAVAWSPPHKGRLDQGRSRRALTPLQKHPTVTVYLFDHNYTDWVLDGPSADVRWHPCVMAGFDNTPRYAPRGLVLHELTPTEFASAVARAVRQEQEANGPHLVFVKSWNEWAESSVLEPDLVFGRALLEALQRGAHQGVEQSHQVQLSTPLVELRRRGEKARVNGSDPP